MKRFISKKTVAIGLTAGLVLGVSGAALAFWTTAGSGSGSATTNSLSTVGLTGTAVSNLDLGVANSMTLDINNFANTSPVNLNGLTLSITAATCGGVSVDPTWFTTGTITEAAEVAAGSTGVGAASAPLTLVNKLTTDQNSCQGKAVVLTLSSAA